MRIEKCKHCGAEIIRIRDSMGHIGVYDAEQVMYWSTHKKGGGRRPASEIVEIATPNGEHHYATLTGELNNAIGIGYLAHTCFQGRPTE